MTQAEHTSLFEAIRLDDASLFGTLIAKKRTVTFGRFPLLSVCYLFSARRILRTYSETIKRASTEELAEEPILLYTRFAKVAGKALRFFMGDTAQRVHPLVMLALMGDRRTFAVEYASYTTTKLSLLGWKAEDELFLERVMLVRDGFPVKRINDVPQIQKRGASRVSRRLTVLAVALIILITLVSTPFLTVGYLAQAGAIVRQFTVRDTDALTRYANKNLRIRLDADIDIGAQEAEALSSYSGILDANGHTLRSLYPLSSFAGTIANATIYISGSYTGNTSFCNVFQGTLQNCTVVLDNVEIQQNTTREEIIDSTPVGIVIQENRGRIEGCTFSGNASIQGTTSANAYAGIVADNYGLINQCTMEAVLTSDTLDIGGFVGTNYREGKLNECTMRGKVMQTTGEKGWNTLVGGLVFTNHGAVESCFMLGRVSAHKTYDEAELSAAVGEVIVGGVAGYNFGTIWHSVMDGEVYGASPSAIVYLGGIVGVNATYQENDIPLYTGVVSDCIAVGKLGGACRTYPDGTATLYSVLFAGGISGYDLGSLLRCYSAVDFTPESITQGNAFFMGGLIGYTVYTQVNMLTSPYQQLYFYRGYNGMDVGYVPGVNRTYYFRGMTPYETVEEIHGLEGFWYEQ